MTKTNRRISTRELTIIAVLAAIAAVLFFIEIPIVAFYKLDVSSLPALLGTFALGPWAGTLIMLIKSALGLLHSSSQGVGELADFIMGVAMILPAGLIYGRMKSRAGAIVGMAVGTVAATVAAVLTNYYLLIPFYGAVYGLSIETIVQMGAAVVPAVNSAWKFVMFITAPFNLFKWIVISVLGALIYKPLSPVLHGRSRMKETTAK